MSEDKKRDKGKKKKKHHWDNDSPGIILKDIPKMKKTEIMKIDLVKAKFYLRNSFCF